MRLLFVQDSLGTGGAERSNADLWYDLREKGWEIKVAVLEHRTEGIEKEILNNGIDVTFLEGQFLQQVFKLKKIINSYNPDLVQSVLFRASMRVRLTKILTTFIHVESLVNCSYSPVRFQDPQVNSTSLKVYQAINRYTQFWGTDKFLALTMEVRNHAIKFIGIPSEKIIVIPRGRKENPFLDEELKNKIKRKLAAELNFSAKDLLFVHVGRQEFQKAHLDLLKALTKVGKDLKRCNVTFIFCGRKGNESVKIENYIKSHKISVKLHWIGHRHDVPEILAASDVFVFPSLIEGLGGALIEAQAAGLPIICSNIKVFDEVVNRNENALMFEAGDVEDLSKKLVTLAESPQLRKKMGTKSLLNFRENFNIKEVHQKMVNFYNTLKK